MASSKDNHDIEIVYNGEIISAIDDSIVKTLKTGGKYCESDIKITYLDPEKPTQQKSVIPSKTAQVVLPDEEMVLSKVTVEPIPSAYIIPSGTIALTENGTHDVSQYASAEVAVVNGLYNRRYEVTNPSSITGSGNYLTVVSGDEVLKQVRGKNSLIVIYRTEGTTSCVKSAIANNINYGLPVQAYDTKKQVALRYDNEGDASWNGTNYGINDDTDITGGSGRVHITADGDLRIYGNTSGYAIPAGKIIIDVLWGDN